MRETYSTYLLAWSILHFYDHRITPFLLQTSQTPSVLKKRLGNVIIGTEVQSGDNIDFFAFGRLIHSHIPEREHDSLRPIIIMGLLSDKWVWIGDPTLLSIKFII